MIYFLLSLIFLWFALAIRFFYLVLLNIESSVDRKHNS